MNVILDNIIFSLQRVGGISVVWKYLIEELNKKNVNITYLEYEDVKAHNILRQDLVLSNDKVITLKKKFLKFKRYINPSSHVGDKIKERFIFHSSYYRTLSHKNAINVTTVHDFAYEFFENNPVKKWIHCWQKHRALRNSHHIVCISENTKRDLFRFLPDIAPEKVSVIYNGIDKVFFPSNKQKNNNNLLYVGKRNGYKNFEALIDPLSKLNYKLMIVGYELTKLEKEKLDKSGLKYEYCGIVSSSELNKLYNESFCLLYTSLYEGFGLPVLEAQMAGCPVIAYNASSIPEVIGDKTLLLDAITADAIKEKLEYVENNRDTIVNEGLENVKRFSWEKMAIEYCALYKTLLKQ